MSKQSILNRIFGHTDFRPGQETLVDALLAGRDALGIMPTGGGKSVCYQIPALMLPGVAIVISPLISLMKDQVAALKASGVPAAYLNSTLTPSQQELALRRARDGQYRLIYVAPERLEAPSFLSYARSADISLVAVDEAHCVSQWGQDFRPNYLRIAAFIDSLPKRPPVGAFTATATQRVREDIVNLLGLKNPELVITGFDRPNLFYEVIAVRRHREHVLLSVLEKLRGRSGIVYCATRKNVEKLCALLRDRGLPATRYHAGLEEDERRRNQEDFQYDRAEIMVATNAFGMGIDKSNVSFVIHYNMPKSVEAYYQEAGRAGRDGSPSDCVLLFSMQDVVTARRLITGREPNSDLTPEQRQTVIREDLRRLQRMIDLCQSQSCFRSDVLRYFGQATEGRCQGCSRCMGPRYTEAAAITEMERVDKGIRRELRDSGQESQGETQRSEYPKPAIAGERPDAALFERLRACRLDLAREQGVPPYVICHDRTLRDMAEKRPSTLEEMMAVYGMGQRKVEAFGPRLLAVLLNGNQTARTDSGPPETGRNADIPLPFPEVQLEDSFPAPNRRALDASAAEEDDATGVAAAFRPWPAAEIQRLFDAWYAGKSMWAIANDLNRTRAEVLLKADDLGILGPRKLN